ncbi:rhomboid family intramembrane serine protease [Persicirhabdus sediminis]|uniref:Rhomboid family intramembrane serine protease n=1 Tax=Persicirhabdus sediminis TaxID=454144 RepID=A0A8J7SKZ6_9BACT|nr:rhomboid family intramembrane serine protease [Persicirhabdus sediminis]MBK1791095.1 rhomboid family intramembrane serine protease [Persicirhabdus sediminis]
MTSELRYRLKEQAIMLALIGVICLVYLSQLVFGDAWFLSSMVVPNQIVASWNLALAGELDLRSFVPMVSYAFLHGGFEHLAFNMLYLWIFGGLAVQLIGSRWMLIVFFLTAACGCVLHVVMNADSPIPMLGASGAVMGFEGLYLGMVVRWRLPNPKIWPMAHAIPPAHLAALGIIGLVMDYMGYLGGDLGVAYSAHLGGFIGGVVVASLVVPRPRGL